MNEGQSRLSAQRTSSDCGLIFRHANMQFNRWITLPARYAIAAAMVTLSIGSPGFSFRLSHEKITKPSQQPKPKSRIIKVTSETDNHGSSLRITKNKKGEKEPW